ncbi:SIMPL domain-containing protein [Pseudoroseicyclus tamaricis]|uniref:SIMPL domain-containing protein n=1 Tax=Pseudoroseicyclus tamaricis TaxID=2705421 RepID=A0A6B2JZA2_9RHOB|nr:SIMPL domain-containing protein [Pseudoroseicyclus tamaricis]NDV01969.1 SIMPL domain-containing protein [Pseudoroseicyclus tamaricis]
MRLSSVCLSLGLLAGLVPGAASAQSLFTVTGTGEAAAKPDMAIITVGVEHRAESAEAALDAVSAGLAPVIEQLRAAGIPAADIQTSGLRLDAQMNYEVTPPEQTGFVAGSTLTVRIEGVEGTGELIDELVGEGANQLYGISFGLSDSAAALEEARRAAVADARERAELYAEALGVTLGPIAGFSEGGGMGGGPVPVPEMRMMDAGSMPVAGGELSVSASVTISWVIEE